MIELFLENAIHDPGEKPTHRITSLQELKVAIEELLSLCFGNVDFRQDDVVRGFVLHVLTESKLRSGDEQISSILSMLNFPAEKNRSTFFSGELALRRPDRRTKLQ